jgi:tetratricopeptide (TPR) repeat protein
MERDMENAPDAQKRARARKRAPEDFKKALELCDNALELNPGLDALYLTRAACFLHLKDLPRCARAYKDALADGRQFRGTGPCVPSLRLPAFSWML